MANLSNILCDFSPDSYKFKNKLLPTEFDRTFLDNIFGQQLAEYLKLDIDNGPWIAGGAVRKSYLNINMGESDWDIWFKSPEQFVEAENKLKALGAQQVYTSSNAISYKFQDDNGTIHNVQIIRKRFYDNAEQIINGFDFTVCQLVTDGNRVIMGPNTARDLKTRTLRLSRPEVPQYIIPRMVKYIVYGYQPCLELLEQIEQVVDLIDWSKSNNDYETI